MSDHVRPVLVPITKAERVYIIDGLRRLDAGFARDLAEKFEETKCKTCRGSGCAPYVGGDDDETPCGECRGTGFPLRVWI